MATDEDVCEKGSDGSEEYDEVCDPEIERYLWNLEQDRFQDVVEEIVANFDMEELQKARRVMFKRAKAKLHEDLGNLEAQVDGAGATSTQDKSLNVRHIADPWDLINRRSKERLVEDLCKLSQFSTGWRKNFPDKILRRSAFTPVREWRILQTSLLTAVEEKSILTNKDSILEQTSSEAVVVGERICMKDEQRETVNEIQDQRASDSDKMAACKVSEEAKLSNANDTPNEDDGDPPKETPKEVSVDMIMYEKITAEDDFPTNSNALPNNIDAMGKDENLHRENAEVNPRTELSPKGEIDLNKLDGGILHMSTPRIAARQTAVAAQGVDMQISTSRAARVETRVECSSPADSVPVKTQPPTSVLLCNVQEKGSVSSSEAKYVWKGTLSRDMSTQTDKPSIRDQPVTRAELERLADFVDNGMADLGRRVRASENRQDRCEKRIDSLEVSNNENFKCVFNSQDRIIEDLQSLSTICREVVEGAVAAESRPRVQPTPAVRPVEPALDTRRPPAPRKDSVPVGKHNFHSSAKTKPNTDYDSIWDLPNPVAIEKKPGELSAPEVDVMHPPERAKLRDDRKGENESAYGCVMRAAREILPASQRREDGRETSMQRKVAVRGSQSITNPIPRNDRVGDRKVANKMPNAGDLPSSNTNMNLPRPLHQGTPKPQCASVSWVDDDSDGIDEAILSIVENDIRPASAGNMYPTSGDNTNPWGGARPKEQRPQQTRAPNRARQADVKQGPAPVRADSRAGTGGDNKNRNANDAEHDITEKGGADAPPSGESQEDESISYAKMVTRNGWRTQTYKKRKRTRSSPKAIPNLKGIYQKPKKDIYVYGVDISVFECMEDIEYAMTEHCRLKGVQVMYAKGLTMSAGQSDARLRVAVAIEDYDRVLGGDFWPADVFAREWFTKNKSRKNNFSPEKGGFGRR